MPPLLTKLFLRDRGSNTTQDHFPTRQLFVLALCRICEPIAFMSIFPYAYRMIETFNITSNADQISIYAGMLITAFAFAEFSTGVIWGRVSDRVGRKPVLVMGLVGTALSMLCFGFATSLPAAILARALGGLLNGNVGVLQTTVAELVTKKEHQPRAYSIMPFVWGLGSIIGPAMGGALAQPCESYPRVFPRGGLFDTYPFLLPNLVCVIILIFGIINGVLFLEETHAEKRGDKDWGRELGQVLINKIFHSRSTETSISYDYINDQDAVAEDDPPPGYRSTEGSPRLESTTTVTLQPDLEILREKQTHGVVETFNRHVVLIIVGYAILAYHSVSFDALMPILLSEDRMTREQSEQTVLPFKFLGGFGKSTQSIGFMMAVQASYSMFAQLCLFPYLARKLGSLQAFRSVMTIWPALYFIVPYLVLLPERLQTGGIYLTLMTKITFQVIAFPSNAILLANAAPSKSVLGTINGVAASTACLARSLGPVVTGLIHSAGLKLGYNGLGWWAGGIVCAIGALESYWMEDTEGRRDRPLAPEEPNTCEPLLHSAVEPPEETSLLQTDSLTLMDDLDLTTPRKHEFDFDRKE
ncbi:hypothetical protein B0A52_09923 [Exophiala mesophila]|uniref:Major facilitator superfamily (MFS) profile domain-containing protein n=1 Tax=Exophiala mesophila TaxID=212818 RepID=A0A438MSD8_EXOME|nr:hypothetical protein B0A52_09923 [Exophiala mesophila]